MHNDLAHKLRGYELETKFKNYRRKHKQKGAIRKAADATIWRSQQKNWRETGCCHRTFEKQLSKNRAKRATNFGKVSASHVRLMRWLYWGWKQQNSNWCDKSRKNRGYHLGENAAEATTKREVGFLKRAGAPGKSSRKAGMQNLPRGQGSGV